jgi:hypothetical protein
MTIIFEPFNHFGEIHDHFCSDNTCTDSTTVTSSAKRLQHRRVVDCLGHHFYHFGDSVGRGSADIAIQQHQRGLKEPQFIGLQTHRHADKRYKHGRYTLHNTLDKAST